MDAGSISAYAVPGVQWLCSEHILNGMGSGVLATLNSATRAEIATMLYNFIVAMQ